MWRPYGAFDLAIRVPTVKNGGLRSFVPDGTGIASRSEIGLRAFAK